ncbi:rod shape-determining protein [Candidatus Saccharibacteria bacterium]|nr:rod shape-determining protein [Candidatus Saccharibacteria bacterium]
MSFLNKLPLKPESSEKTEQKSTLLALDIGTSFVKCVLAQPVDKDKPDKALKFKKTLPSGRLKILGFAKAPESPGNIKDGRIADIQGVVASCEKALAKLESQTGERASAVVIGVSGEQIKSKTSTIRYRRDTPNKPITSAELEELLKKIEKRNLEKLKAELSLETDNPEVDLNLINSAVVSISIDGYRINNPVGFRGAEVLIEYYTAFAPSVVVSAAEKVCAELELELLTLVVEPFAVSRACLGDDVDVDFSAVLIDVGAGKTGIAVVDSGDICGTKMFNIGGNSFTRQLSESLSLTPKRAELLKLNLDDDLKLSDATIAKTSAVIERSLSVWLAGASLALEEFKNIEPLPADIFLSGGSSNLVTLQETLALSDWYQDLPFSKRPLIRLLDPSSLPDFIMPEENAEKLDASFVVCLGLLRVAVDTLLASPDKTGLKAKLSKLLSH